MAGINTVNNGLILNAFNRKEDFPEGTVLLMDKPYGWTSFNLVRKVQLVLKKELDIRKIKCGHAGTLDPLASGLMILCTGKATKKINEYQDQDKEYIATLTLGATTPSCDLETDIDQEFDIQHVTKSLFLHSLNQFTGEQEQIPPVYSAVSINGKRAYEYARKGEDIKMKAKTVWIRELELLAFNPPEIEIRVVCSKGTYIRSLVRDIGLALNAGAYLSALERTAIGDHRLSAAMSVEGFEEKVRSINAHHF